jgi:enoyl-CoA hydratase
MPTVRNERIQEGIALVTLDRPDRLNAMSHELVADLHAVLDEIKADATCRVVVLTGAGRGFCAGLDLKGTGPAPGTEGLGRAQAGLTAQQHIATLIPKLRSLRQPVIAAVNGAAAGGGFALALGSDIRIAAASARFNVAFVRIGLSAATSA